ncbi:MAG TPA: hypothetical protein VGO80_11115 [Solirubrobacteraceae bacterium]|nr:hypothetical protein [Solirubrobacteraceae bacterium]
MLIASRAANQRQVRQLLQEREDADRAELRSLLDETAAMAWDSIVAGAKFYGGIDSLADRFVAEGLHGEEREARLDEHGPD